MIVSIILFIMGAAVIWAVVDDIRAGRREAVESHAKNEAWLAEQLLLPRYQVLVVTKGTYRYFSEAFEPAYYYGWRYSSLDQAQRHIEECISTGRYYDPRSNTYTPMCEIHHLQAVKA